jgi:hypothetical protein
MVIKSKRMLGTPVSPDVLGISCWDGIITGDMACGDKTLGFSGLEIPSSGVDSEPFISSLMLIVSSGVILIGSNSWGSFYNLWMTLWDSSNNNIPILCPYVASTTIFSFLTLRASRSICSIISTFSSILIALNIVIFGLAFLYSTSSQS